MPLSQTLAIPTESVIRARNPSVQTEGAILPLVTLTEIVFKREVHLQNALGGCAELATKSGGCAIWLGSERARGKREREWRGEE